MADLNMNDLSKKHGDFYAPSFVIEINGKDIFMSDDIAIPNVSVSLTSEFEANGCNFTIHNLYDIQNSMFPKEVLAHLMLGNVVKVSMGYIEKTLIFIGVISGISFNYGSNSTPSIDVECLDVKSRMMDDKVSKDFKEKKCLEVVNNILNNYKTPKTFEKIEIESTQEAEKESIEKHNESDYQFLCRIARQIDYKFYVQGETVFFRKADNSKKGNATELIDLTFGSDLINFRSRRRLSGQVHGVTVRNTDGSANVIEFTAHAKDKDSGKEGTAATEAKISKDVIKVIVDPKIKTKEEAEKLANSILNDLCMNYISCSGSCVGFPEFLPGRYITVKNLGMNDENSDRYYIIKTDHSIDSSGYTVSFEGKMDIAKSKG